MSLLPLALAMTLLPLTVAMSLPPRPAPREPPWDGPSVAVAVGRRFRRLMAVTLAALAPRFFRPLESAAVARLVPRPLLSPDEYAGSVGSSDGEPAMAVAAKLVADALPVLRPGQAPIPAQASLQEG